MELELRPVDVGFIPQLWPLIEDYLWHALEEEDTPPWSACYNIYHVQSFLTSGAWMLVIAVDNEGKIHGAATVSFSTYPLNRVAFITLIGGKFISSRETFLKFKQLLQRYGATKIQGFGKPSIVRLWRRLGFEPRVTLVETNI